MTRLQTELERLYLAAPASLADAQGRVRALVLEAVLPASWDRLSAVWQGVQAELELPAPAIAVSGTDGVQLWFAERHQPPWLKQIDRASIDLGTGKRMLVKGGKLDPKYLITVPDDLDAPV